MECGHERRSLASCGHVAGAQVRNDVDARELCDERGMIELQREALLRTMADRLAVHAECGDVGGGESRSGQKKAGGFCIVASKRDGGFAHALDFVGAGQRERRERSAQVGRKGERGVPETPHDTAVEGHGDGVRAVKAGAGHESDRNAFGHGGSLRKWRTRKSRRHGAGFLMPAWRRNQSSFIEVTRCATLEAPSACSSSPRRCLATAVASSLWVRRTVGTGSDSLSASRSKRA